ncbi:hypothetical protein MBANPS3_012401 [Mucor bainieri]
MKLRDKAKHVLSNIKPENGELFLTTAEASTSMPTELTANQEDTREHSVALSQQHDEFGKKDYYYQCDKCKLEMANTQSVVEHRASVHSIQQRNQRAIKHFNTEPTVHDPNFYCRSCERSYKNTKAYRQHLRIVHFMALKPLPLWKATRNNIVTDPNEPNLY